MHGKRVHRHPPNLESAPTTGHPYSTKHTISVSLRISMFRNVFGDTSSQLLRLRQLSSSSSTLLELAGPQRSGCFFLNKPSPPAALGPALTPRRIAKARSQANRWWFSQPVSVASLLLRGKSPRLFYRRYLGWQRSRCGALVRRVSPLRLIDTHPRFFPAATGLLESGRTSDLHYREKKPQETSRSGLDSTPREDYGSSGMYVSDVIYHSGS